VEPQPVTEPEPSRTGARPWHRNPHLGLGLIIAATAVTVSVGFLGPSSVTLTLGPRDGSLLPPWYLPPDTIATPNEWFVSGLIALVLLLGAAGLGLTLRGVAAGWQPNLKRLFGVGLGLNLVTIMVPPMTSADVLMYAAYGRLQRLGLNPYDITPAEVFRSQFDEVLRWVERPWHDTPSVYGPLSSWTQWFANILGGDNMHDIVFWLQVSTVLPFIVCCIAVIWLAHGDAKLQARAILLTIANPLMIWSVVAGAHNEAWAIMFAIIGVLFMRRSAFGAGLMIGLAGCFKLSIGLYGLAMLWGYRKQPRNLVLLCLGTLVPMGLAYGLWEPSALVQVLRNTTYVSVGSWVQPLYHLLTWPLSVGTTKLILNVVAVVLLVVIAWMLSRVLPWRAVSGLSTSVAPQDDPITITVRTALLLSVAWLTTSLYTLAWYDLMVWAPLALLGATRLDKLFVWRGVFLSLSYVPGRAVEMSDELIFVTSRIRDTISPIVQIGVLVAIVAWWWIQWYRPRRDRRRADRAADPDAAMAGVSDGG